MKTALTINEYLAFSELHDLVDLANHSTSYDTFYVKICEDIKKNVDKNAYLFATVDQLKEQIEVLVDNICNPELDDLQDDIDAIRTMGDFPAWIVTESQYLGAIEYVESGHTCMDCRGSGEGSSDGSRCTVCKGKGAITFEGIFDEL